MANKHSSDRTGFDIFHKLCDLIPDLLSIEESGKSQVDGYMDLNLDVLHRSPERLIIALSHYYKHPSGDMIADPDMEVAVFPNEEFAEALTYQDTFGYQAVDDCEGSKANRLQASLNRFLVAWLGNLISQGHRIITKTQASFPLPEISCNQLHWEEHR